MPQSIKNYLMKNAGVLMLIGVGAIVFAIWTWWNAAGDHAYTQREQLQTASGKVVEAREMVETRKGRRGRKTEKHWYEIDLASQSGGDPLKLKIDFSVGIDPIQEIIEEDVTALYDSDNEVYEVIVNGNEKPTITYEQTRDRLKQEAENLSGAAIPLLILAALLIALGRSGLKLKRKAAAEAAAAEAGTPAVPEETPKA